MATKEQQATKQQQQQESQNLPPEKLQAPLQPTAQLSRSQRRRLAKKQHPAEATSIPIRQETEEPKQRVRFDDQAANNLQPLAQPAELKGQAPGQQPKQQKQQLQAPHGRRHRRSHNKRGGKQLPGLNILPPPPLPDDLALFALDLPLNVLDYDEEEAEELEGEQEEETIEDFIGLATMLSLLEDEPRTLELAVDFVEHDTKQKEHELKAHLEEDAVREKDVSILDVAAAAAAAAGHRVAASYHAAAKEEDARELLETYPA
jgi:hypothetical protein